MNSDHCFCFLLKWQCVKKKVKVWIMNDVKWFSIILKMNVKLWNQLEVLKEKIGIYTNAAKPAQEL